MNLKRFLALTLTGIITFSNVAYAAEDVSALENSADPAVVEEAAEDTAEDLNVVYEDADSVFDAVDEEITEEETEAEELLTEDSEEAVTIFEDEEEVTVEPIFEMMDADREMELYDKLDSTYETLVSSYDIEVPEDTEFPVTITMEADVLAGDEVLIYHFDEAADSWEEIIPDEVTDGEVTATFNSLSPVGIVKLDTEKKDILDTLSYQEFSETVGNVTINVSGDVPEGYFLSVETLNPYDYADMITEATDGVAAAVYDIKITDGKNEYQPSEYDRTLNVSFSGLDMVNEGKMSVVHIDEESGAVEQKGATVDTLVSTDTIEFETDSFSPYALVLATSSLSVEGGTDQGSVPFIDDYYGTTTRKIYHMSLTYGGSTKEAFCLDHGLSASSGDTFVQNGQYAGSDEVKKILTGYFADENGTDYQLSYSEAQVLLWAAMAGKTTSDDSDSDGTLDYVQIMQAVGGHSEAENATAVTTIEGITTYGSFYAWDPAKDYTVGDTSYTRDPAKQRFITLLGKAPVTAAEISNIDSELWQVGDNAYAYIDDAKVLHITGYGDCWDQDGSGKFAEGRGYYTPVGEYVPYRKYLNASSIWTNRPNGFYTSVTIDDAITGIGAYMFQGTYSNQAATIEADWNNIRYVGNYAFSNCYASMNDTLSFDDLEYLGTSAFAGVSIQKVELNGSNTILGSQIFDGVSSSRPSVLGEIDYNIADGTRLNNSGSPFRTQDFSNTTPITLRIGANVETVGESMFSNTNIAEVDVTSATNWTTVGKNAFSTNSLLTEFTLPESVTTYGGSILSGCSNLTAINHNAVACVNYTDGSDVSDLSLDISELGNVVKTNHPIYNCSNAHVNLVIGNNVEALPANGFYQSGLVSVTDNSDKLTKYVSGLFYYNENLATVTATNSNVTKFEPAAFYRCSSLADIDLTQYPALRSIGCAAFLQSGLEIIEIPDSVEEVGARAFSACSALTTVTLGKNITALSTYGTFYQDTALELLTFNCEAAEALGYSSDPQLQNNYYVWNHPNVLYIISTTLSTGSSSNYHGAYIPDHDCTLIIGEDVEVINSGIFSESDFTHITWPTSGALKEIKQNAFAKVPVQGEVVLPEGLEILGGGVFEGVNSTNRSGRTAWADYCNQSITSITVPESVTSWAGGLVSSRTGIAELHYNAVDVTVPSYSHNSYKYYYNTSHVRETYEYGNIALFNPADTSGADMALYIGANVETIPEGFCEPYITELIFEGNGITTIPRDSFADLKYLTAVEFPEGITTIKQNAFSNCKVLTTITLPDSITSIAGMEPANYYSSRKAAGQDDYLMDSPQNSAFYVDTVYSNTSGIQAYDNADYDRDSDGVNDALTTTLICSDDNMTARTYKWLKGANRYVANAISVGYTVTLPTTLELTDPGDGVFINNLPVGVVVNDDLDSPISIALTMGSFKNASDTEWNLELGQTTPTETVQTAGDYSFDCEVSGIPVADGVFTGNLTCTVTE